ncbi:MAG: hypothetical protein ACYDA6_08060 [Solirubrobacteraceae bacterium]
MRFAEFLKTTVLLSAGAATALGVLTVLAAADVSESTLVWFLAAWWVIAAAIGLWLGRRAEASPAIADLLAEAKVSRTLPEQRPVRVLFNRLWPLLLVTLIAGGLSLLAPQIPGIGAGFAIIWSFAWRRQHGAVTAIERRDGVAFYLLPTSPLAPIALQRTPGFKAMHPEGANGALL